MSSVVLNCWGEAWGVAELLMGSDKPVRQARGIPVILIEMILRRRRWAYPPRIFSRRLPPEQQIC